MQEAININLWSLEEIDRNAWCDLFEEILAVREEREDQDVIEEKWEALWVRFSHEVSGHYLRV
jgi:hypothetical protein